MMSIMSEFGTLCCVFCAGCSSWEVASRSADGDDARSSSAPLTGTSLAALGVSLP